MKKLLPLLLLWAVASCSKGGDDTATTETTPTENKAPQAFAVSLSEVTVNSALLTWLQAKDPEGQKVTYSVEVNNQAAASGLTATSYRLENLANNTTYTGKVIAADPAGNKTETAFTVSTADHPQPSDFTLTAGTITHKSIALSWTAATLPDNSAVTYDVYVDDVLTASGQTARQVTLNALASSRSYNLKIVAKSAAGRSREKTITLQTAANTAPGAFTISQVAYGFSYISTSSNKAADANNDSLTYYLVKDGVEAGKIADHPQAAFSYVLRNLEGNRTYSLAVKVKDGRGGETTSNAITVKTKATPETSFPLTVTPSTFSVALEWTVNTQESIDAASSYYWIDGVTRSLGTQVTSTVQPDNSVKMKIMVPDREFALGELHQVKVVLNWGPNNSPSTTQSVTVPYDLQFTPTATEVASATMWGPSKGYAFEIYFKDGIIASSANWDMAALKFDNVTPYNYWAVSLVGPGKGYMAGNFTSSQYESIKSKSTGYVIVKDAGGVHKVNFTYTVIP